MYIWKVPISFDDPFWVKKILPSHKTDNSYDKGNMWTADMLQDKAEPPDKTLYRQH